MPTKEQIDILRRAWVAFRPIKDDVGIVFAQGYTVLDDGHLSIVCGTESSVNEIRLPVEAAIKLLLGHIAQNHKELGFWIEPNRSRGNMLTGFGVLPTGEFAFMTKRSAPLEKSSTILFKVGDIYTVLQAAVEFMEKHNVDI